MELSSKSTSIKIILPTRVGLMGKNKCITWITMVMDHPRFIYLDLRYIRS
jgi:hypothetical protein